MLITIDIGGTSIKAGLWDRHLRTSQYLGSMTSPTTLEGLLDGIHNFWLQGQEQVRRANPNESLAGMAISSPGAVNPETGIIGGVSQLPYIHHIPFPQMISERIQGPVSIANDAYCSAFAELKLGAGMNAANVVFLVIGTGIGGLYAVNGDLVLGHNHSAGEFGLMRFANQGKIWSRAASTYNFIDYYRSLAGLPQDSLLTGEEIFDWALAGQAKAEEAVRYFYDNLAEGIYNLLMAFDPERVVIGGGISQRDDLIPQLESRIDDKLLEAELQGFDYQLVPNHFKNHANLIGAGLLFDQERWKKFEP